MSRPLSLHPGAIVQSHFRVSYIYVDRIYNDQCAVVVYYNEYDILQACQMFYDAFTTRAPYTYAPLSTYLEALRVGRQTFPNMGRI